MRQWGFAFLCVGTIKANDVLRLSALVGLHCATFEANAGVHMPQPEDYCF